MRVYLSLLSLSGGKKEEADLGLAAEVGGETHHQWPNTAVMNQKGAFGSFFRYKNSDSSSAMTALAD